MVAIESCSVDTAEVQPGGSVQITLDVDTDTTQKTRTIIAEFVDSQGNVVTSPTFGTFTFPSQSREPLVTLTRSVPAPSQSGSFGVQVSFQ